MYASLITRKFICIDISTQYISKSLFKHIQIVFTVGIFLIAVDN